MSKKHDVERYRGPQDLPRDPIRRNEFLKYAIGMVNLYTQQNTLQILQDADPEEYSNYLVRALSSDERKPMIQELFKQLDNRHLYRKLVNKLGYWPGVEETLAMFDDEATIRGVIACLGNEVKTDAVVRILRKKEPTYLICSCIGGALTNKVEECGIESSEKLFRTYGPSKHTVPVLLAIHTKAQESEGRALAHDILLDYGPAAIPFLTTDPESSKFQKGRLIESELQFIAEN